jgi:hypothetical protein
MVSFTPRPFYPQRKSPWYPLNRRLGGPQSRFGHGVEEKNSQPLPGQEHPIIQPVAQHCTTELSRLLTLHQNGANFHRFAFCLHLWAVVLPLSVYFFSLRVAYGGDGLHVRRVAANLMNKQSWTAEKWWSSSLGVGLGANNSSR